MLDILLRIEKHLNAKETRYLSNIEITILLKSSWYALTVKQCVKFGLKFR